MKSLFIGIFGIVIVSVLFFAYQFVRNTGFSNVTKVSVTEAKGKDLYIDINRNSSFEYPKEWVMHDPSLVPGYAPVFKNSRESGANKNRGFVAFGIESLPKTKTIAEDIELYSYELPLGRALQSLTGGAVEIIPGEVKKVTYKSGISGFTVDYEGENELAKVQGRVFFFYTLNGIEFAFSTYIEPILAVGEDSSSGSETTAVGEDSEDGTDSTATTEDRGQSAAQIFLNQAQESLINVVRY